MKEDESHPSPVGLVSCAQCDVGYSPHVLSEHQENVPFVFGVFVSRKVSLVTLALGNLSLSVSGFGKASSALNFYL